MKYLQVIVGMLMSVSVYSADLVVQDGGPSGTYSSIGAAVAASVDGDRILINNKTTNLPWIENVTINKSISLLSAVPNQKFVVNGEYTIERNNGRVITIIGMYNVSTNSNFAVDNNSSYFPVKTKLNIVNCELSGDLYLYKSTSTQESLDVYFAQNKATNSTLGLKFGKVIGNELSSIRVLDDLAITNDTVFIVGNKVIATAIYALYVANSTQPLFVSNNYFENYSNGNATVYFYSAKEGSILINNSINAIYSSSSRAISGFDQEIINCCIRGVMTTYNASKCFYNITSYENLPTALFNQKITSVSFNPDGSNAFTGWLNAGNPSNHYLDLDLTRNDVGCFGGSYSFTNFHPIVDGKSARVSFVQTPRVVYQGQLMNAKAIGVNK